MLKKLTLLGAGIQNFQESRIIDEDNDIYPPPLMTKSPSYKVSGFNRIQFAIWYFKPIRVAYLITLAQANPKEAGFKITDEDGYGSNLISIVCRPNHPTNINYENNKHHYENMLFTVLEALSSDSLKELFERLIIPNERGIRSIQNVFKMLKDRPHMLIALWNYGLLYEEEDLRTIENSQIRILFKKTINNSCEKRYKLLDLVCPITLEEIEVPTILSDGTVYEYQAIKNHLRQSDMNPLTNERLFCLSQSNFYEDGNGNFKGVEISTKIIYLPEAGLFEHFNLIM